MTVYGTAAPWATAASSVRIAVVSAIGANAAGLITAITASFIPSLGRLVRARVLELRELDYVEAARINTDPEIEFYLMGSGENEAEILEYIAKHNVRIDWLGYRQREETLQIFATMQVGVSPASNDLARVARSR